MKITGHTRLLGFFAEPAAHSKSPAMYNACFDALGIDAAYLAFRCGKEEIGSAMEAHENTADPDVDTILAAEAEARQRVREKAGT